MGQITIRLDDEHRHLIERDVAFGFRLMAQAARWKGAPLPVHAANLDGHDNVQVGWIVGRE